MLDKWRTCKYILQRFNRCVSAQTKWEQSKEPIIP
jgi:hypothetical protein